MATTEHFYTGNNSTTSFAFTFPYLANSDVKVELDNVLKTENSSGQTNNDYTINNTNIVFNSAPGSGVNVHIYRNTNVDTAQATYAAGSSIRAVDLNNNQTQVLYSTQEAQTQQIRTTDIKDGAVNSTKIENNTIVNADINTSAAIDGTKVSPDFGSQNIVTTGTGATGNLGVTGNITVSGTVDGRDVAADGTKLDTVETNAKDDQTAAEIRTLVESANDSNVFTNADHTKLNGIETAATADQTAAEIRTLVENASDSNVFTNADHTKLNGIEASATADQTASEIKTLIASSPLDATHLAANSVTTSEIADSELTTLAGMQSGTASKLADSTALTSDIADLNQIDGMAKQTTITDDDAKFPTSGAVVDYVAAQIAPLGGLEVISNEVSFPNTQPASGVVISISDAGGTVFNGSGVSTTGRTVGGSTVTINGAPSSLNGETLVTGVGLMVSSTGSSQTYNYHKILGKEDDIKQLSDDINDFNARYRVGSSNPTSALDSGDMFFNTSTGKMLVYNGVNSAWEEVQSIGNFFISTFSESIDGSRTAFTVSNAPTNAQQLIISINGVIQKPNSGTGQPSEGFTLNGSTVTFSSAIPSGSDYFAIVLGSSVNQGTPSNNTVTTAILQNGSVTTAKIADTAVTTGKIATDAVTNDKIDVDAIDHTQIIDDAVRTQHIAAMQITEAKMASDAISESVLKVSNSPTNGYFLSAQSGNTGGLTWAEVSAGVTSDGQNNTVAGTNAGDSFTGTDANNNTLIGYDAGTAITTGDDNTSVGAHSLGTNNTGSSNSAFGQASLNLNTTGSSNTAYGQGSLRTNTTASSNTAVGKDALKLNTTGSLNTAVGFNSLTTATTATGNSAFGWKSLEKATTGGYNTGVGYAAGENITTGQFNVAVGTGALDANTTASNNSALGYNALGANTTGIYLTAVGSNALDANTTGSSSVGIGKDALGGNTTGAENVAVGTKALEVNTTGGSNVAIGHRALDSNTTASHNTVIGHYAGSATTTGASNCYIGRNAGYSGSTANHNTGVGGSAPLYNVTTGTHNTVLGTDGGQSITTGTYNVCLGNQAGTNQITTESNRLYIARAGVAAGNAACWIHGDAEGDVFQGNNDSHWATTSDQRLKKGIVDNTKGLEVVDQIKVRNFKFKQYKDGSPVTSDDTVDLSVFTNTNNANQVLIRQGDTSTKIGVVAQELETVLPNSVKTSEKGVKTVLTDELFWHMLNAIKELSAKVTALEAK